MRLGGNEGLYRLFPEGIDNMLVVLVGKKEYSKTQKDESGKARRPVDGKCNTNKKPDEIGKGNVVMGKKKIDGGNNVLL